MTKANTRIAPNDAQLPFLATLLDERTMACIFERHLIAQPSVRFAITQCEIERIKYRPHRNCLVAYRLTLNGDTDERELRVCVGMFEPAEAQSRYLSSLSTAIAIPQFAPVIHIEALDSVMWVFPNERKLKALPILADAGKLRESVVTQVVRSRWGAGWEIVHLSHSVSNYFPEHSCCAHVHLNLFNTVNATRRNWEIIGKIHYDDAGSQTHETMSALWGRSDSDVAFARPLVYAPDQQIHWQERVPGVTLHSLLETGAATKIVLNRIARAIGALHRISGVTPQRIAISDVVEDLNKARLIIADVRPDCAAAVADVVGILLDSVKYVTSEALATMHGDLHSKNILVDDAQIYLVDLDRVCIGPAIMDLGSFLAELIYRGCISGLPWEALELQLQAIVESYCQSVPWRIADKDMAWHTASALIRERALRAVTSLKPGGWNTLREILATAHRIATDGVFSRTATASRRVA